MTSKTQTPPTTPRKALDDEDTEVETRHSADEVRDEGPLESLGEAVSAPVLDAIQDPADKAK